MPATAHWHNEEHTIIMETFEGSWTWQEFSECIGSAKELISSVDYPIYAIADYTNSNMMPMNGSAIKYARDVMSQMPTNWAGIIIVSQNHLIRTLVNLFRNANRTFGDKVYLEPSIEAAIHRIKSLQSADSKPAPHPLS